MNTSHLSEQELLARLFDGRLSDADREELHARMQTDADLADTVRTVERLAAIIPAIDVPEPTEADTRAAWKRLEARLVRPRATIFRLGWVAAAAAVIVLTISVALWLQPGPEPVWESVATARGDIRTVTLDDGSTVTLNADTRLEYAMGDDAKVRRIRLDGQARFDVATDGRAFVVQAGEAQVRVLGTQFSVRARGATTSVAVHEGRVAVASGTVERELVPGEGVEVRPGEPVRMLDADAARTADDWTRGVLTFQRVTLEEALDDIGRTFDVDIALSGPWMGGETVSGSFPGSDVEQVLSSLCRIYACTVQASDGAFDLVKRSE